MEKTKNESGTIIVLEAGQETVHTLEAIGFYTCGKEKYKYL